jgi:hypothetical protein
MGRGNRHLEARIFNNSQKITIPLGIFQQRVVDFQPAILISLQEIVIFSFSIEIVGVA